MNRRRFLQAAGALAGLPVVRAQVQRLRVADMLGGNYLRVLGQALAM